LHPPLLDELGLQLALDSYIAGLAKRSKVTMTIDFKPLNFPRLTPELEATIFRLIQESLTNVFRHSGAGKAWITLLKAERVLVVTVRDDGKGIPQKIAEFKPDSMGVGISGMRQRVKELGGELRMRNTEPGTIVEVRVPMQSPRGGSPKNTVSEEFRAGEAGREKAKENQRLFP
jgi:signal transduction histidine kinase